MIACTMKNLKDATSIDARNEGLKGEGSAPVLSGCLYVLLTFKNNCAASGRVPKELANLTNLGSLSLYGNQLQMPDGAPTDSDGDMDYRSRGAVAAFQACLI